MRILLAQINPTVGDIAGNGRLIEQYIERARDAGADLVVFPELALSGYPPKDLLYLERFLEAAAAEASRFGTKCSRGITIVFGVPLAGVVESPRSRDITHEQAPSVSGLARETAPAAHSPMIEVGGCSRL